MQSLQRDIAEFDLGLLEENQRSFYQQFLELHYRLPNNVKPEYVQFVAEGGVAASYDAIGKFAASAGREGPGYRLRYSIVLPVFLHFVFNRALKFPYVFSAVGDPSREDPDLMRWEGSAIPFELPDSLRLTEAVRILPGVNRPEDAARASVASALSEIATAFCAFHEMAHVIGGHVAYRADRCSLAFVPEFFGIRLLPRSELALSQVFEREADLIALNSTLALLVSDPSSRSYFAASFGIENDGEQYPYHAISVLVFALTLLFLYLAQVPTGLGLSSSHPHPIVRITYLRTALRLAATNDLGLEIEDLDSLCDYASEQAFKLWNDLGLDVPALAGANDVRHYSRSVRRAVERLERNHELLYSRYSAYSWLPGSAWKTYS